MNFSSFLLRLLIVFGGLLVVSCEKEVSFKFNEAPPKVVVEGQIEHGQFPIIHLSKSLSFLGLKDFNNLSNIFIKDAIITISDGIDSVTLIEYENLWNPNLPSVHYYSIDMNDPEAMAFIGAMGKSYSLKIQIGNDEYFSHTTIPYPQPFDSIWVVTPPNNHQNSLPENARSLYIRYNDPDTLGNRYRISTSINGAPFLAPRPSVYSDELANGAIAEIAIKPGSIPGDTTHYEHAHYFYLGDTVIVKWSAIDKATYNFYNSLEYSSMSTGNPFAAPISVLSNIQGADVLGVWAGMGSIEQLIIIEDVEDD